MATIHRRTFGAPADEPALLIYTTKYEVMLPFDKHKGG